MLMCSRIDNLKPVLKMVQLGRHDTQHNNKYKVTLSIMTLSINGQLSCMLSVIYYPYMLSIIMLNVVTLSVVAPNYVIRSPVAKELRGKYYFSCGYDENVLKYITFY
jgi:hypothetical protein